MKPKQLIPFVVVLLALGGLVFWQQSKQEKPSIVKQARLVSLTPEGISPEAVTRLDLYGGAAQSERVSLVKQGDAWSVASHFNAPVDKAKLDEYLGMLLKLQGEARTTAAEDSKLESYELKNDQAFHVELYTGAETPAFHLLVGKAPDARSVFLRKADGEDIFVEGKNPRSDAGVTATGAEAKPTASHWYNKDIIKIEQDRIKRVALTLPDKSLVLERVEKLPEPEAAPETDAPDENAEAAETPEPEAAPAVPELVWQLASGGLALPLKEPGVESLLQKIATFVATDIVDPMKKAEWGLEPPAFTAEITLEGDESIIIEAGRPDPAGDAYVMLTSNTADVVYLVNKFNFERLFAKGNQLFDLPKQTVAVEDFEQIHIQGAEGEVLLQKDGDWRLVTPATELELQTSTVNNLVSTLANLSPNDYADDSVDIGEITHTITYTAVGQTHTVRIAGKNKSSDGRYVLVGDNPMKLAISQNDVAKIALKASDIFTRNVLDIPVGEVSSLDVVDEGQSFQIERNAEASWTKILPDSDPITVDAETVEDLLFALDELQIDGPAEGVNPDELTFKTELQINYQDGSSESIRFTSFAMGSEFLTMQSSSMNGIYHVKMLTLVTVLGTLEGLRKIGMEEAPSIEGEMPNIEIQMENSAESSAAVEDVVLETPVEINLNELPGSTPDPAPVQAE